LSSGRVPWRNVGFDHLEAAIAVHALDFAAPAGQIAHHLAHAILGDPNFDRMDRLEQASLGGHEGFLEREVPRDLEGDILRVHGMHFAVVEVDFTSTTR